VIAERLQHAALELRFLLKLIQMLGEQFPD